MSALTLALRRHPLEVLASLASEPGAFLLEVPDAERSVTLLGCTPTAELRLDADASAWCRDDQPAACFHAIEEFVRDTPLAEPALPFPLAGGVIGYLAYELGSPPAPDGGQLPAAVLRRYDPVLVYDHTRAQYTLLASTSERARAPWLERLATPARPWDGPLATGPLTPSLSLERYRTAVRRILDYLVR
jgi:anthranilate/para-aminobenzoate synthase component I